MHLHILVIQADSLVFVLLSISDKTKISNRLVFLMRCAAVFDYMLYISGVIKYGVI